MDATTVPAVFNFNTHAVRTVVKDGEPWFVAADVCAALDYKNVSQTIGDNLDDDEKGISGGYTPGGAQKLTIISESGLYALVLRSRKPEARKFAKWVTSEVLPAIRKTGKFDVQTASGPLTVEMRQIVKDMVIERAKLLPLAQQGGAMRKTWAALKSHFGVGYKEIPTDKFAEALSLVARMQVEWEVVESEALTAPAVASYHYPLEACSPHDRKMESERLTPRVLLDPKNRALELELIDQLENDGHDVTGLKMRILALRDATEHYRELQYRIKIWRGRMDGILEEVSVHSADRGKPVMFTKIPNPDDAIDRRAYGSQMKLT